MYVLVILTNFGQIIVILIFCAFTAEQGDQIGSIFAHWAAVNFEQFFNDRSSPHFCNTLFDGEVVH
jgi:hypothetical protein